MFHVKRSSNAEESLFSFHWVQGSPLLSRETCRQRTATRGAVVGTTGQCESENLRGASFPLDPESERPSSGFCDGQWAQGSPPGRGDASAVLSRWQGPRATTERGVIGGCRGHPLLHVATARLISWRPWRKSYPA